MKRAICLLMLCALNVRGEDLTTTEGKVYKNVTIRKVEPDGLSITHESGLAKVPFTKLPKKLQQQHGYDREKGKAYAAEQAGKEAAALREIEKGVREKKGQAERESEIAAFTEQWSEIAMIIDQSTDEGILGEAFIGATAKWKATSIEKTNSLGKVLVIGPQGEKVDGEYWRGKVWPAGTYQYRTVLGAATKVHCYASDPLVAMQRLGKQKSAK